MSPPLLHKWEIEKKMQYQWEKKYKTTQVADSTACVKLSWTDLEIYQQITMYLYQTSVPSAMQRRGS